MSRLPRPDYYIGAMASDALAPYGIGMLTGEACCLGLRILCDVTDQGRQLFQAVLGMPDLSLAPAMNSKVGGRPSTGSIMVPFDLLYTLKVFALATQPGVVEVWEMGDGGLRGMTEADCAEHASQLDGYQYGYLDDATWNRWYELRNLWRCNTPMSSEQLAEYRELEQDKNWKTGCGVKKVYVKGPRNRRGPATRDGLQHIKQM